MYGYGPTFYGQAPPPTAGPADLLSATQGLFQTSAALTDVVAERKLEKDLEKYSTQQRAFERRFAKRFGRKTALDTKRAAGLDSRISQLQALVDQRRKARLALWGSVGVLALLAFVAFRPPPTVRVASIK